MRNISSFLCFSLLLCVSAVAYADSEALCPSKLLETKIFEGIYMGSEALEGSGGGCFSTFKPDNGDEVFFFDPFSCDGEDIFGNIGNRVSVTYEVSQEWVYRSDHCAKREIIKSGQILAPENLSPVLDAANLPKTYTNSLGMEFMLIPAGTFMMGSDPNFSYMGWDDEMPQHQVTIPQPFYLAKYEVTQEQWVAVMGTGSNPAKNKGRANPVENVLWKDVTAFIQKINQKESGRKYRLPTEAEWEYAARAGSDMDWDWFFSEESGDLGYYAWCGDNSRDSTHPVGEKQPNPWGLYDMYGNVSEWVEACYVDYKPNEVTDSTEPIIDTFCSNRVLRGGSWQDNAHTCRSTKRIKGPTQAFSAPAFGFRLAFSPDGSAL